MNVLTKTDFATLHGVSRAAVTMAAKRGTIAVTPDGAVNVGHSLTRAWVAKRAPKGSPEKLYEEAKKATTAAGVGKRKAERAERKSSMAADRATKAAASKQAEIDVLTDANELTDAELLGGEDVKLPPLADIDPADIWRYPKASLDKLRIFEVALKTQQDREQKRGELIPRDLVASAFSKIHAVDSNEWRTLEERLIPTLCSVAGFADDDPRVLKIQKAINKETTRILRHTQRLINNFLETHAE